MAESMVEKVARAICAHMGEEPDQKTPYHPKRKFVWEHYIDTARVAIEALREPTKLMKEAGDDNSGFDGYVNSFDPTIPYQAMIAAALNEEATG